jgi:hypothetical protein
MLPRKSGDIGAIPTMVPFNECWCRAGASGEGAGAAPGGEKVGGAIPTIVPLRLRASGWLVPYGFCGG